jgi:hypothetical protein
LLVQGYDGDRLRQLAGGDGTDHFAVADLLPSVLEETGPLLPATRADALNRAFGYVARLGLGGRLTERAAVQMVEHLIAAAGFEIHFHSLLLGGSYWLDESGKAGGVAPKMNAALRFATSAPSQRRPRDAVTLPRCQRTAQTVVRPLPIPAIRIGSLQSPAKSRNNSLPSPAKPRRR